MISKKFFILFIACLTSQNAVQAQFITDPTPIRSTSPSSIMFTKELTGFANYGTEGAADILYTGNTAVWTFTLTQGDLIALSGSANFLVSMSLDDHYGVDPALYGFTAQVNSVASSAIGPPLSHGLPFNSIFNNWTTVNFSDVPLFAGVNTLRIVNTSMTGPTDWIAVDRIQLNLPTSAGSTAPEPSTLTLFSFIALGIFTRRRKNH